MTDDAIQEQIDLIKKATSKAARSKESALKFLKDAGIIDTKKKSMSLDKKKK